MKKMKLAVAGASLLMIVSCGTNQGNGALIGTGAGAGVGAIIGAIAGHGKGAAIGAALGGAIGAGTGAIIGHHMDKVKSEVTQQVSNAKVDEVTDANGLKAVKVTFDSGLQFDINKATLRSDAQNDLANFANVLKKDPTLSVDIQGYTDATGGDKINVPLSDSRAKAVSSYLEREGVPSSQFKNVAGYGSQNPVVNQTIAPQNRRVEVYLYASKEMIDKANNGTLQ
ncbi:MAG: OmpA family protein [Prevotella sp.]|jgi:outer membrane protein OmpA-like peptidoglycan-associated protein|uniref:OmpA family protein n=1 Tax=Segatella cerevisiae TaxID=2053716 RepID=A0ABT1BVE0_9BACT|nr:OmpA family protein [Segatella cerevisiae]MCH3995970.1 OmpA family protein [Prevotella sp.]MCI1246275.1 OmpA family protein [Prevotella sp.]MCO6025047.1 OmpA family protein [Segatella cerevisiae]